LPSAPAAIAVGLGLVPGMGNVVTVPVVVMVPALPPVLSTNQRSPPGPDVMPARVGPPETGNDVCVPAVVMRTTAGVAPLSVNQRFPSGPPVIAAGVPLAANVVNCGGTVRLSDPPGAAVGLGVGDGRGEGVGTAGKRMGIGAVDALEHPAKKGSIKASAR